MLLCGSSASSKRVAARVSRLLDMMSVMAVRQRRCSATHRADAINPRRCRGLTEYVTAPAVIRPAWAVQLECAIYDAKLSMMGADAAEL